MPEMVRSSVRFLGAATTRFWRTVSLKTMKAGLPVFAASDLRQARRLASRDFCSLVYEAVACSRSALRVALDDFGLAVVLVFFRLDDVGVFADVSLMRRSVGSGPLNMRPSWVRAAFLKVMRLPSGLVH